MSDQELKRRISEAELVGSEYPPPGKMRCRACGEVYGIDRPDIWFPTITVHEYTQSLVIMTRSLCCGVIAHAEPVATISAYLRDVKGNARLVCNLVNQHALAGRPYPDWLVKAWVDWERAFERPKRRSRSL